MQMSRCLYICRKWEKDEGRIGKVVEYLGKHTKGYQIVLFPEGTNWTPETVKKSRAFEEANNLKALKYVLQPRTTGFTSIVQQMRERKTILFLYTCILYNCIPFYRWRPAFGLRCDYRLPWWNSRKRERFSGGKNSPTSSFPHQKVVHIYDMVIEFLIKTSWPFLQAFRSVPTHHFHRLGEMAPGTMARKRCVFAKFLRRRAWESRSTSASLSPAICQPGCLVGTHFEDITNAAHILVPLSLALDLQCLRIYGFDIQVHQWVARNRGWPGKWSFGLQNHCQCLCQSFQTQCGSQTRLRNYTLLHSLKFYIFISSSSSSNFEIL